MHGSAKSNANTQCAASSKREAFQCARLHGASASDQRPFARLKRRPISLPSGRHRLPPSLANAWVLSAASPLWNALGALPRHDSRCVHIRQLTLAQTIAIECLPNHFLNLGRRPDCDNAKKRSNKLKGIPASSRCRKPAVCQILPQLYNSVLQPSI